MCNTYIPIPMKVEKILIENPDRSLRTYDLSFVNEEDKKKFVYMPGQFCEFSILGKGESPFGIASSPTEDGLKFTVSRTGSVTNEIHYLEEGDIVGIRGPMGNWYPLEKLKGQDIVIIGGGFAFTTLRSMIVYMLENRDDYGKIIHNPNREWIENLDDLPFPAWHLIDISRYKLPYIGSPFLMVTPHRGCPYNCTFCTAQTYYGSKIRIRSVQNVISELWYLKNRFNIDHIFFWSDTFTGNKKFVKDLCKAIIDEKLSIHWTCNSRIDTVDIELLQIMKKAGCFMISYGIESADPSILSSCGKKTTPEKAKEAVRLTKKAGIMTVGHFILGLPGETEKSANKSIMFAKSIGLDFAQFYFAVPFPGSRLYQTAVKEGWIEKGDFSSFEQDSCIMNLPTITKNKLESLRKKAYKEFYLRPSIIPWGIKHIRFNHIIESIKIALNFIKWSKGEKKM